MSRIALSPIANGESPADGRPRKDMAHGGCGARYGGQTNYQEGGGRSVEREWALALRRADCLLWGRLCWNALQM